MASAPSPLSHSQDKPVNGHSSNIVHVKNLDAQAGASESRDHGILHRISEVRRQQGVSVRCAARQLGTDATRVREQEQCDSDLTLSELYAWQRILEVPVSDLLMDPETPLSRPVMERARLVRLMKTAAAILEESKSSSTQLLAERLIDQLLEIMPELKEVGAWHSVGQRRSLDEFGRVFENRISEEMLSHYREGHQE